MLIYSMFIQNTFTYKLRTSQLRKTLLYVILHLNLVNKKLHNVRMSIAKPNVNTFSLNLMRVQNTCISF